MRLWSLHPGYLDRQGLVALWREALLAQAVLAGTTRGYRHHPQLDRFRVQGEPAVAIADYLRAVADEADRRGYRFDRSRIVGRSEAGGSEAGGSEAGRIAVTAGQMRFEWSHLVAKLRLRDADRAARLVTILDPLPHPLFRVVEGRVERWERAG